MYIVDRIKDGERVRLGAFADIVKASNEIDKDAQLNGPEVVYHVERVG